ACFTPMVRPAPCSTPCPYTTLFRSVPALDPLIRPRAHAGYDEQVDAALVAHGMAIEELQCPVYHAGFVAVHPSGNQHAGLGLVPAATAHRQQRIVIGPVVQLAVRSD